MCTVYPGIYYLIFSDHVGPQVTETLERESADKGENVQCIQYGGINIEK